MRLIAAAAAALLLAGCAATPHRFELAGSEHALHWWLPDGPAARLVVLAPGFARRCTHLQGLARGWAAEGMQVLCLDAPMAGGAPDTAAALAGWLAAGLPAPPGGVQAARVVVAGHSATDDLPLTVAGSPWQRDPRKSYFGTSELSVRPI